MAVANTASAVRQRLRRHCIIFVGAERRLGRIRWHTSKKKCRLPIHRFWNKIHPLLQLEVGFLSYKKSSGYFPKYCKFIWYELDLKKFSAKSENIFGDDHPPFTIHHPSVTIKLSGDKNEQIPSVNWNPKKCFASGYKTERSNWDNIGNPLRDPPPGDKIKLYELLKYNGKLRLVSFWPHISSCLFFYFLSY